MRGTLLLLAACTALSRDVAAAAQAPLVAVKPEYDEERAELSVWVDGVSGKSAEVRLLLDGKDAGPATALEPLASYYEDNPKLVPPLAVGVVYQCAAKYTPGEVQDGVESFLKRFPLKTSVCATPYGQGFKPPARKLDASRAAGGDLGQCTIVGDQFQLLEAIRLNAEELQKNDAPIKYMLIVTDGRDYQYAQSQNEFTKVGGELLRKKLRPRVLSFPAKVDQASSQANLRELAKAADTKVVGANTAAELPQLGEDMSEAILNLKRARFQVPRTQRWFDGKRRVGIEVRTGAAVLTAEAGTVFLPGGGGGWLMILLVLLLGAGAGGAWVWQARGGFSFFRPRTDGTDAALLDELHEMIRLGIPAARAVEELSQAFPDGVQALLDLDPTELPQARYRYLRTRAGQLRLREIQQVLREGEEQPTLDEVMAQLLAQYLTRGSTPEEAARRLRAQISAERWSGLARAPQDDLEESLQQAAQDFPALARADALGFTLKVQQALRGETSRAAAPLAVAWLVRAAGPGLRGQTLRIPTAGCQIGRDQDCAVRLADDAKVAPAHARIVLQGSAFAIEPLQGQVLVEGSPVSERRALTDGETIEIGSGRFVFKSLT